MALHSCRTVLEALQLVSADTTKRNHKYGLPEAISLNLERVVYVAGDYIIREGDDSEGMYFVSKGFAEARAHARRTARHSAAHTAGVAPQRRARRLTTCGAAEASSLALARGAQAHACVRAWHMRTTNGAAAPVRARPRPLAPVASIARPPPIPSLRMAWSSPARFHPPFALSQVLNPDGSMLTVLGRGSFFGEMALLHPEGRTVASVHVSHYCDTYFLSREAFERLIALYPSFREYLQSVAKLRRFETVRRRSVAAECPPTSTKSPAKNPKCTKPGSFKHRCGRGAAAAPVPARVV